MDRQLQEHTEAVSAGDLSLDDIVAELDREYSGVLPEPAIRAAQRRREEVTPRLIDLIHKAAESVRAGDMPAGEGHLFALFLLTEFRAKEALPAILDAFSLPGDGPFDLFGDAVTEDLSRVLAELAADRPDVIDELIANRSLNKYVRWEAAQTCLHFVRDGRMTRDQAVGRLRGHLRSAIENRDAEGAGCLVLELVSYAPLEALDDIKAAYGHGLIDELLVVMDEVEESIANGDSQIEDSLATCPPTGVEDTVEDLSRWAAFQPRNESDDSAQSRAPARAFAGDYVDDDPGDDFEFEGPIDSPTTIRRAGPRVGRNDPCPCGSGKKYKKCCGRK